VMRHKSVAATMDQTDMVALVNLTMSPENWAASRAGEARRSEPLTRPSSPSRWRAWAGRSIAAPGPRACPAARTAPPLGGDRGWGVNLAVCSPWQVAW